LLLVGVLLFICYAYTGFRSFVNSKETTTRDIEFTDDRVIVVIEHEYGGINKVWYPSDFPDVDIESIEDLTYVTGNIADKSYLNKENFTQIICIYLNNKSRENVLKAIESLEKYEVVLCATPNLLSQIN